MFLKDYKIYLISAVAAAGISCLYNFVFLFNLYELFQTTSFIEFTTDEKIKFIYALAWLFSVLVVVLCVILFNYSWKDNFTRRYFIGWNKQFANIISNFFLFSSFMNFIALVFSCIFIKFKNLKLTKTIY